MEYRDNLKKIKYFLKSLKTSKLAARPRRTDTEYKKIGITCVKCGSFRIQIKGKLLKYGMRRLYCIDCKKWFQIPEERVMGIVKTNLGTTN